MAIVLELEKFPDLASAGAVKSGLYSQMDYGFFVLPTAPSEHLNDFVVKFKELRLQALKESPEAWLSSYDAECNVPFDEWLAYLRNPRRHTFICVAEPKDSPRPPTLTTSKWIGMIQLLGPYRSDQWTWPLATEVPLQDDKQELRYHVTGAFVVSGHRRSQPPILARLIWFYNDWQVHQARKLLWHYRQVGTPIETIYCRQRSVLTLETQYLRTFYERLGTIHAGFITAAEEFLANEDKVPLPPRTEKTRDFYEEPSMMAFEKVLEVTVEDVWPEGVLASLGPWLASHEKRYGSHETSLSSSRVRTGETKHTSMSAPVQKQLRKVAASKL